MDRWLLTFFIGAVLSLFLPEVPTAIPLFLLLFFALACLICKKLHFLSGLLIGFFWVLVNAHLSNNQLPKFVFDLMQTKQSFIVEGEVLSLNSTLTNYSNDTPIKRSDTKIKTATINTVTKKDSTTRFNFSVKTVNKQLLKKPIKIRLSWTTPEAEVAQGNQLILKVKLKPIHGLSNVGTFNYVSWLRANNISSTGYVVNSSFGKKNLERNTQAVIAKKKVNILREERSSVRQILYNRYSELAFLLRTSNTSKEQLTPLLLALTFGDKSLIKPQSWNVLQATGTSHLIAISGLHIGLLASSTFFVVMLFIKYLPIRDYRLQQINIRYLAIVISLVFATGYAYLAGFSLPTQRALVMLNIYWLSRILGIRLSNKRLLLLTVFIILIFSPFSILTASFWLSFYAVTIIFITLWRFKPYLQSNLVMWRFLKGLLIVQISLTIMLIPISAIFFEQIPLFAFLSNIVAVPWMSSITIPSALFSLVVMPMNEQLAQWFMVISLTSLELLWQYLTFISQQNYALISLSVNQQVFVLIVGLVSFIIFFLLPSISLFKAKVESKVESKPKVKRTSYKKALTVGGSLMCLFVSYIVIKVAMKTSVEGDITTLGKGSIDMNSNENSLSKLSPWQIVFFDVGQGLSVLIRRGDNAILYDTGAAYPSGFTLSEAVILPYLQYESIKQLDKVILSHSDNDHAGGIDLLVQNIKVDELINNDVQIALNIKEITQDVKQTYCNTKQSFIWQALRFKILWPISTYSEGESIHLNKRNNIFTGEGSFFKEGERLPKRQKNDDSCVILITDELGRKVLLTGDISKKVEKKLLSLYPTLKVDTLQVPHHGSKTSSTNAFLKQLSPDIAVVSAGYLNRWRMPVRDVSERYHDEEIILLNNADLGQIIMTFDNQEIQTRNFIEDLRPFWFTH